jgi:membrane-associated protease RseP (regulator of RpoE activity)
MPLIPYFPQIFGVESLMPPFYFTYFLIALIIVAVVHEFSHGIYMRLFKTKIKSTGFAFLGPILGAFVEQDDKDFRKKKNFDQMVVLAAGVFANILFALIFFFILVLFFYASYYPAGYIFDGFAYNAINVSEISGVGNTIGGLTEIIVGNKTYLYSGNSSSFYANLNNADAQYVLLYEDAPAIRNNITGVIVGIDNQKVKTREDISFYLQDKRPGDILLITTLTNGNLKNYSITLTENPLNSSRGFVGIVSSPKQSSGIIGKFVSKFTSFRDSSVYYEPRYNADFAYYIYNLLWWIMMINLFVGLFNMLPLGILDGGRFFYLAILILVKDKNIAEKSFKWATRLIGLIFLAMILAWIISLF